VDEELRAEICKEKGVAEQGFELDRRGHVALLTFNRPERMNALTREHMIAVGRTARELGEDPDIRAVVITGAGRAFSAGADLKAMQARDGKLFGQTVRFAGTPLDFIGPLLEMPKPTIAAVNGIAVGAGLGIALACDIRLCGRSGAFLANFRDHAIAATDGVTYLLPRLVGVARTLELLYSGERVDAERALAIGLANHVHDDDLLLDEALAFAEKCASAGAVALQSAKMAVLRSEGKSWSEAVLQQELAYLTTAVFGAADMREAQAARAERRAPDFRDTLPNARPIGEERRSPGAA
jgi:2-(1,2-epoxy-1,2-dihydrophenyl)acetyl-CoA isomerase